MKKTFFINMFLFFAYISIFAVSKPVVVIATFDAKGFTKEDVEFVMSIFTSSFTTLDVADIVDRSSFDKIKKELSFQDSDWSDSNKVAKMGKALNATQVVVGQLIKRSSNVFLTVKILDVNTTKIIASCSDKMANVDDLFDKMPEFCHALVSNTKGSSFTSLKTQSAIAYGKYNIGDEGPGGGIIFYTSKEGFYVYDGKGEEVLCHYLEMSRNTLGDSLWFPEEVYISTQTGLGYGRSNTYKILEMGNTFRLQLHEGNCAAYSANIYTTASTKPGDWWLPSKDELDLIYKAQKERVLASSQINFHWSSSQDDVQNAWVQNFDNGEQHVFTKDFGMAASSVRAVRAF